jgi:tetratricopeptide (TPR) repeat protein
LGNVFEPYLSLTVHFDIFNKRLLEGYTLVEAAWNATPVLSWMNVVCGDPLYRPYAKGPGSSMGDGRSRDYALYQGTAMRYTDENSRDLKKTLTDLAESRSKPHLLELTGLLSASEGKISEAIDLLEHAETLYVLDADKVRSLLYLADLHRLDGRLDQAKKLIQRLLDDPVYQKVPAAMAARSLLEQM